MYSGEYYALCLIVQGFFVHVTDHLPAVLRTAGPETWNVFRSDAGDLLLCYLLSGAFTTSSIRKVSS